MSDVTKDWKKSLISVIDPELTINDVHEKMLGYLIEEFVFQKPHIVLISKEQLWWGKGQLFKSGDKVIDAGIRFHIGLREPSATIMRQNEMKYGYPVMVKPYSYLNKITNTAIRKLEVATITKGHIWNDVIILPGLGYVNEKGVLNPERKNAKTCYFLMLDPNGHEQIPLTQQKWLDSKKGKASFIRYQFLRNIQTHTKSWQTQRKMAQKTIDRNRKLLNKASKIRLTPHVDRAKLDWIDEEEDE